MSPTTTNYIYGTGRRKTAIARVRLLPGDGGVIVNGKLLEEFFGGSVPAGYVTIPFRVLDMDGRYSASVLVSGGGFTGQAGAIRHGIARALLRAHPNARGALRSAGLLTRDPRAKERKKFGLKRARKAPQFTKR